MKKLSWSLVGLVSVSFVSAQSSFSSFSSSSLNPFADIGGIASQIVGGIGMIISGGDLMYNDGINLGLTFIAITILLYSLGAARFASLPKWSKVTLSIIVGYWIMNTPIVMGLAGGQGLASIFVVFVIIMIVAKFGNKLTISDSTRTSNAEHDEKRKSRKEKKRDILDQKLNSMETFLQTQEDALLKQEDRLETAEKEENQSVLNDINSLLETLRVEEKIDSEVKKMRSYAKTIKDPLKIEPIISRANQYNKRLKEFEEKLNGLLEKFESDITSEENSDNQEDSEIIQENEDDKKEYKDEKEEEDDIKDNIKDEKHEAKIHYLPNEDREREVMKESTSEMELSVEERKHRLIKDKKDMENKKKSYGMHISKLDKKIDNLKKDLFKMIPYKEKEKLLKTVQELETKKQSYHRYIQSFNREIERIDPQLEKLESEETNIENKEEKLAA